MIISFYSYKGGVGRTQLCANVASYLCHRKGKSVLLWEWDFEAPGLHYFFDYKNKERKVDEVDGTIELFYRYSATMLTTQNVSEDNYIYFADSSFFPLVEQHEGKGGKIDLIPAGNYNDNYVQKVNNFDWVQFYKFLDGYSYIEKLKQWIREKKYDYIFIDSRTGINDYSGICNIQLPDTNVVLMAANDQNIDGCERIINSILKSEYTTSGLRKSYIFPILSRINSNHPKYDDWATKFSNAFHHLLPSLDSNVDSLFSKEIFKEFYLDKTLLADDAQFSAGENLLIRDKQRPIPKNSFMAKFATIGEYICNLNDESKQNINIMSQVDKDTWEDWAKQANDNHEEEKAQYAYEQSGILDDANLFFAKGEKDKAIEEYEKVLAEHPDNHYAWNYMGNAYFDLQKYDMAIESYLEAIKIKPNRHESLYNLGFTYQKIKEPQEALNYYKKAVKAKPGKYEALVKIREIYELNPNPNNIDELINYFESLIEQGKELKLETVYLRNLYNLLGNVYYYSYRHDYHVFVGREVHEKHRYALNQALTCYNKAISISNDFDLAYFNKGNVFLALGEFDNALESYKSSLEFNKSKYESITRIGLIYHIHENYEKAIYEYQEAKAMALEAEKKAIAIPATSSYQIANYLTLVNIKQEKIDSLKNEISEKNGANPVNSGHIILLQDKDRKEKKALAKYKEIMDVFFMIKDFFEYFDDDFLLLEQYGIRLEDYLALRKELVDYYDTKLKANKPK